MITTSQESHTRCTLSPQPQAAQLTLQRDPHAHLIPTQDLEWAPKRDAGESPHLDAPHPFPSFPPALPQCRSRAEALHPLKGSSLLPPGKTQVLEPLTLQTPSEKWCLTLQTQKHSTKNLPPALLSCQPHLWSPQKSHPREMLALPSLRAERGPRSHTQFRNLGLGQVLCIRLNLQKLSPKQAKLDKFCNIWSKLFSFTNKRKLIS